MKKVTSLLLVVVLVLSGCGGKKTLTGTYAYENDVWTFKSDGTFKDDYDGLLAEGKYEYIGDDKYSFELTALGVTVTGTMYFDGDNLVTVVGGDSRTYTRQ